MAEDIVLQEGTAEEELVWVTDIDYLLAACTALDAVEMHSPMTKAGQQRQASAKRKCLQIIYHYVDSLYKEVFEQEPQEE